MTREEVIKSLETAVKNFERYSGDEYGREYDYARVEVDVLEDALALLKAQGPITGETSDGYHTFNELYHHRAVLFSVIVANYPDRAWKSKKHHDGTMYDGMFIVGIDTPDGQATYHYDVDPYWDMFKCRVLDNAPEWDGHTPAQAIERIGKLKAQEPRVMTVEELCRARGKPAWFEARNGRLYTGWVIIYDVQTGLGITGTRVGVTRPGHVTIWPNVELYGKKWRCWTGEPTEEQRRETAWN